MDGAGAELHTSACYHCRRNLLPLLQKSALECPRIPRAWVWASVALEPSSEDYLKDNFSSQPNVSTEILYPFFFHVVVMSVNWWYRCVVTFDWWISSFVPQGNQVHQKFLFFFSCFFLQHHQLEVLGALWTNHLQDAAASQWPLHWISFKLDSEEIQVTWVFWGCFFVCFDLFLFFFFCCCFNLGVAWTQVSSSIFLGAKGNTHRKSRIIPSP